MLLHPNASSLQYLELRFDKRLRTLQTFMFIIAVLLLLPVTLFLPALVFSEGKESL